MSRAYSENRDMTRDAFIELALTMAADDYNDLNIYDIAASMREAASRVVEIEKNKKGSEKGPPPPWHGLYRWDGQRWLSICPFPSSPPPSWDGPLLSPDSLHWWNGQRWVPLDGFTAAALERARAEEV